jgi:chromosome segregation ATPase
VRHAHTNTRITLVAHTASACDRLPAPGVTTAAESQYSPDRSVPMTTPSSLARGGQDSIAHLHDENRRLITERDDARAEAREAAEVTQRVAVEVDAMRRRCEELEMVVVAVEAEKTAALQDASAAMDMLAAQVQALHDSLATVTQSRDELLRAAAQTKGHEERHLAIAQLESLEARNELLASRAEIEHARTRAIYAEGELALCQRTIDDLEAEREEARDGLATERAAADHLRALLGDSQRRQLATEESRSRQAITHDWMLYAAQRSYHASVRRATSYLTH